MYSVGRPKGLYRGFTKVTYMQGQKVPLIRDYVINHKIKGKNSRSTLWLPMVLAEHRKHEVTTERIGKQMIEIGNPETLLKIFDELERNEDLASSIEGVMRWTRSLKPRDIKF